HEVHARVPQLRVLPRHRGPARGEGEVSRARPRATAAATKHFACVPVYLEPRQRLGLTSCEVIPGVTVSKISKTLGGLLDSAAGFRTRHFAANHVILIDVDKYARPLEERIRATGRQVPTGPDPIPWPNPNRRLVFEADLVRQVLISLILLQRFRFVVGGSY